MCFFVLARGGKCKKNVRGKRVRKKKVIKPKLALVSLTGLFNPSFKCEVEKLRITMFKSKFGENHLNNFATSCVIVDGQCFIFCVRAEYPGVNFYWYLFLERNEEKRYSK